MPATQLRGVRVADREPDEKVQREISLDAGGQEGYIFWGGLTLALMSLTKPFDK